MANQIATSDMAALLDEVIRGTDIKVGLSQGLNKFAQDDAAWEQAGDTMWLPQEFRFEVLDGQVSSDSDFEDLIDRMVPVNLTKAKRILAQITSAQLRDPRLLKMAVQGMSRDLKNAIDLACYEEMINRGSLVVRQTGDFSYSDAVSADVLFDDSGLSGFERKLQLSIPHYTQIAETLGTSAFKDKTNLTAFEKLQTPDVGGFDTMRADYRKNLAANATTGNTVNGNQSHTVATKGADDFYQDNRQMVLAITGATAINMPVGSKFTIAGTNKVHPDTKEDTGSLMTFTIVTAINAVPVISPAIVISGPYQNCSAQAATGSAVTVLNTHISAPSIFYTPESTVIVPGNLPVASQATNVGVEEMVTENGIPVRMTYWWDQHGETLQIKLLAFFDVAVINPEQVGVIIANQS